MDLLSNSSKLNILRYSFLYCVSCFLSSISKSIIEQDMAERKLAETVAVVVTPKESVGV